MGGRRHRPLPQRRQADNLRCDNIHGDERSDRNLCDVRPSICRDKGNQACIERLFLDIAGHGTQIDDETSDLCHPCQGIVFDAAESRLGGDGRTRKR
jgi:hypothetical protein